MQKLADITLQNNQFVITGDLNFSNVMSVYERSLNQIAQCKDLDFNFSQLKSSDSSGLALIVEWVNLAKKYKKAVRFTLSNDLMTIAKAAGVDKLFNT